MSEDALRMELARVTKERDDALIQCELHKAVASDAVAQLNGVCEFRRANRLCPERMPCERTQPA